MFVFFVKNTQVFRIAENFIISCNYLAENTESFVDVFEFVGLQAYISNHLAIRGQYLVATPSEKIFHIT